MSTVIAPEAPTVKKTGRKAVAPRNPAVAILPDNPTSAEEMATMLNQMDQQAAKADQKIKAAGGPGMPTLIRRGLGFISELLNVEPDDVISVLVCREAEMIGQAVMMEKDAKKLLRTLRHSYLDEAQSIRVVNSNL